MKLLMENWRGYLNEEPQVLTEEELNELLQEIGALKSMLGRVRGGKKFAGGYGWEAAVEQWEDEDAQKAAQNSGIPGVNNKEDFVAQVKALDAKAQTSKNPKAQKAIQDLTTNIAKTAEPEGAEPAETPHPAEPEPEETGPGMLARAGASIGRGADKAKQAMFGTDEDPTALGKARASADRAMDRAFDPGTLGAYSNDKDIIGTLEEIGRGLSDNDIELTNKELRKIMPYLVDQLEDNKLSEGLISEADAWETLKHLASKFGRMEKGGKIIGRGKADKENKAKVEAALSKPATKLISDLRDKLEKEYPGFPNTKGTSEFGMAVVEIWMVYDSIVEGVKNGQMEPAAANALIRALYDLVDRYKNYVLADVGRHFTENVNTIDEKFGDKIRDVVYKATRPNRWAADRGRELATQAAGTASDQAAAAGDVATDAIPDAVQDIMNQQAAAGENAYLADPAGWTGPSGLAPEGWVDPGAGGADEFARTIDSMTSNPDRIPGWSSAQMTPGSEDAIEDAVKTWVQDADLQGLNNKGMAKSAQNAIDNLRKSMIDGGADPTVATDIAKASGDALTGQGDVAELAKDAIEQIEPDKAEGVAQAIEKTIGSGATDLAGLEVAGFFLKAVAIPAFIYSKAAIKLLRAKGKHSSREREITKLLDGIDVIPEREGEAEEETNINQLGIQIADIVGKDVGSKLYKQLGSELRRLGYEDVLNEKIAKAQIIDLSNIEIPPDQFDAVAKLLLKGLQPTGLQINLGGKVLNAGEYAPKAEQGVDLSGISDYIEDAPRAIAVKKIIYQVLTRRKIPVLKTGMSENKIFARWREMVLA
jgi:hypothetical protein